MKTLGNAKPHSPATAGSRINPEAAKSGEDRRVFPRVELNIDADLVGESGRSGKAALLNLSRGGAALKINVENGLRVFPEGQIKPGKAVGLRFGLGSGSQELGAVQALGRVVWSQRVGDDKFVLGLEFTAFHGDSGKRIERYLVECMRIE